MSRYRRTLDDRQWERLLADEYAPATPYEQMLSGLGVHDFEQRFGWVPPREASEVRGTYEELRELKIQQGECPLPGCSHSLDEDFYCAGCGNVSLPHQPRLREAA